MTDAEVEYYREAVQNGAIPKKDGLTKKITNGTLYSQQRLNDTKDRLRQKLANRKKDP
jgi:hypothetical protein